MTEKIDILKLAPDQHQALVCMFFAMLPKTDSRYKKRNLHVCGMGIMLNNWRFHFLEEEIGQLLEFMD